MRFRIIPIALCLFLLSACAAFAVGTHVDDVCVGNDTPGPFALSWNHLVPGTETVTINGLAQVRGLDYTMDAESGTVTFARSLALHSAAQITYALDPVQSQQTGAGQTIPLSVDLLRNNRGYLSFNALGKSGASAQSNLTLGVGLGWQPGGQTQLATHFYFAPVTATSAPSSLSADTRSGLSVSATADAGRWALFSFGYARAGVSLGDTGDSSLQGGQQTLTLSSRLTPDHQVQALVSYTQNRATDDPSAPASAKTALALTFTPSTQTQLLARVAESASGSNGATQTVILSVQSQPSAAMQISAAYNGQDAPGTASDTQTMSLKSVLNPGKILSLHTSAAQSQTAGVTTNNQAIGVSLDPHATLQLHADLALQQKNVTGQTALGTTVASVSAAAQPFSFLQLSGSYKNRTASDADPNPNDVLDSSAARVALSPFKSMHLVGTYAQNPDDAGANTFQHLAQKGVSLETSLGALGFSGGCDWSRHYDTSDAEQTLHANLGLRFSAATQLSVGYQCRQNALDPTAPPLSTAYTVGFTHSLGDRFSLSLTGKSQQTASALPNFNATANLGMKF